MAEQVSRPTMEVIVDNASPIIIKGGQQEKPINKPSPLSLCFFTNIHAGYFRITLSFGSQALLWKILSAPSNRSSQDVSRHMFRMLPSTAFLLLWWLGLMLLVSLSIIYVIKCLFHFDMVKREFLHHIGVNYLYAPWVSWLLLLQSSPVLIPDPVNHLALCVVLAAPILMLDLKLYGQWFTTEKRFLSALANPTSQMTVIGNLVVARAAAMLGWKESAVCMFSLGVVHYLVLFVTLYQRLSGGNSFPSLLRPTFFLFFAAPSMASLAWTSITGVCDTSSKMFFFLSLFLFLSLACRPALFKKSMKKFNIAWWAYSFTLTFLALASAEYAEEVKGHFASTMMLMLSAISIFVFLSLMLLTAVYSERLLRENDPELTFTIK